jgi:hypothetical protein
MDFRSHCHADVDCFPFGWCFLFHHGEEYMLAKTS